MDRLGNDLALGLRLINIREALEGKDNERLVSEVIPNSSAPLRATTDLLPRVFRDAGWGQFAQLEVNVSQPDAEILVDDRICVSPCRLKRLQVGTHRVTVQKRGFVTWSKEINLAASSEKKITVSLESASSGDHMQTILLWTGLGLGLVGAGITAWVLTRPPGSIDVCIAADPAQCGL